MDSTHSAVMGGSDKEQFKTTIKYILLYAIYILSVHSPYIVNLKFHITFADIETTVFIICLSLSAGSSAHCS